jgi:hypothetical protein
MYEAGKCSGGLEKTSHDASETFATRQRAIGYLN